MRVESSGGRVEWLDALRALAALWVVAYHASGAAPFAAHGLIAIHFARFLAHGTLAVTAFIALSGYSLGLGAMRRGWSLRAGYGEFVRSRFVRIVPPYLVAIVLTLVLTLAHLTLLGQRLDSAQVHGLAIAFLKHLFLVQDLDGTDLVRLPGWSNGVFWTIGVEFKIYLLFPLMLWAIRRRGLLAGSAVTIALALAFGALPYLRVERKPGFIVVFFLGILACGLASRVRRPLAIGLAALAAIVGLACLQTDPATHQLPRDLAFGAGFCGLLASVESLPRVRSFLEHRWLAGIGTFAYSLYLVHTVVLQTLAKSLPWTPSGSLFSTLAWIVGAGAASVLAAWGFYLVAERPFYRIRHQTPQVAP